jgi:hypothetical protein
MRCLGVCLLLGFQKINMKENNFIIVLLCILIFVSSFILVSNYFFYVPLEVSSCSLACFERGFSFARVSETLCICSNSSFFDVDSLAFVLDLE